VHLYCRWHRRIPQRSCVLCGRERWASSACRSHRAIAIAHTRSHSASCQCIATTTLYVASWSG